MNFNIWPLAYHWGLMVGPFMARWVDLFEFGYKIPVQLRHFPHSQLRQKSTTTIRTPHFLFSHPTLDALAPFDRYDTFKPLNLCLSLQIWVNSSKFPT